MIYILSLLALYAVAVLANTEKVIFVGPNPLHIPIAHPSLEDLQLHVLSPHVPSIRTHIQAEFPTSSSEHGHESWVLLHNLKPGQRYEVRVCWAATVSTTSQYTEVAG